MTDTDANPFVGTNWQVRSDTPAAEEREAVARALLNTSQRRCKTPETPLSEIDEESARWYRQEADAALSALAPIRAQEIAAARAEEQGYRHTQVAALKQVHVAEILAAEANECARIVAWLREDALRSWGADCSGDDELTFAANAIEHGAGK